MRIIDTTHARSAYWVEDGGGDVARQTRKVVVALVLHARLPLDRLVFRQSSLGRDAARHAQRICRDFAVGVRAQVVGRNLWRIGKLGANNIHRATAGWVEVAHTRSKRGEVMQRLTKSVQTQRLHVVFDIGERLLRAAAGESTQLRWRHAHRPTALEHIFHANLGLAPPTIGQRVERLHALHFKDRADLQMVLQISADTR